MHEKPGYNHWVEYWLYDKVISLDKNPDRELILSTAGGVASNKWGNVMPTVNKLRTKLEVMCSCFVTFPKRLKIPAWQN